MRIFISHSSKDKKVAELLCNLLHFSLTLRNEDIRCTSVNGYRLEGGVSTDETLRREVHDAQLFIALITPGSIRSPYVLFELGARWGAGKKLIPLLASGASSEHLRGPLSGINALNCSIPDQVHQLVEDAAKHLSIKGNAPSAYQRALTSLVSTSAEKQPALNDIEAPIPVAASEANLADERRKVLSTLASNSVNEDREMTLNVIVFHTKMSWPKVDVVVQELLEDELVGNLTRNPAYFGLTSVGRRYVVDNGIA